MTHEDHEERTLLAWRRTALSLVAAGALVVHLSSGRAAPLALAVVLAGLGAVIAVAWLTPARHSAVAGLSLVVGVALLSVLVLISLAGS